MKGKISKKERVVIMMNRLWLKIVGCGGSGFDSYFLGFVLDFSMIITVASHSQREV